MAVEDIYWVVLSLAGRIGKKTLRALLEHFDDPYSVLTADPAALQEVPGIGPKIAADIYNAGTRAAQTIHELNQLTRQGVQVLTLREAAYPPRLAALDDAPPTLFVRGQLAPLNTAERKTAALVGTRDPSPAAGRAAYTLAERLAGAGWGIVSGLALGVDMQAHLGALATPGGYTAAVLGGGVLSPYPPENLPVAELLLRCDGALLGEVHPLAGVNAPALVARNRIISGLSDVLIVVETEEDGGAMHAARFARAQGRAVYALDLPAGGNRALIAGGATPLPPDGRGLG